MNPFLSKTKIVYVVFMMFILIINSFAQTKIFFDVKTKLFEKPKLTYIKNAVDLLILESDWASVTEVGENYALWIRNYKKQEDESSVTVNLDIEIREPRSWAEGKLLDSEHIKVIFGYQEDIQRVSNHYELFKQKFHNLSDKLLLETTLVSEEIFKKLFYITRALQ